MLKNFIIQELVTRDIYAVRGQRAWELIDARAAESLQVLRDHFGPCMVNNWHEGGHLQERGLRPSSTTQGAVYSQHKYGRAFDCSFRNATPREVFDEIRKDPSKFPLITVLEDVQYTPTWLHFDTRLHDRKGIWVVNP
jgi:hypothetical protein